MRIVAGDLVDETVLVCDRCGEEVKRRPEYCTYDCLQGYSYCQEGHQLWGELAAAQTEARTTPMPYALAVHKRAAELYKAHLRECSVAQVI
jgi:hypothetical protein